MKRMKGRGRKLKLRQVQRKRTTAEEQVERIRRKGDKQEGREMLERVKNG